MTSTLLSGAAETLGRTHKWVRFMSILGFLSAALMIVMGLLMAVFGMAGAGQELPFPAAIFLLYTALGAFYIVPSLYLLQFANRSRDFATSVREVDLEHALEANRSFWKFIGIVALISIVLSLVGIVLMIALPFMLMRG